MKIVIKVDILGIGWGGEDPRGEGVQGLLL